MKNYPTLEEVLNGMKAKALTIQEPYASLIVFGLKQYETRSWPTSYRGPVLIHAGKKTFPHYRDNSPLMALSEGLELTSGAIIGVGYLTDCIPITSEFTATLSDSERAAGFYSAGRFAWKIENVVPVVPVKARGWLGLWNF